MKVNHVDCSAALKFRWSCIHSNYSSQSGRTNISSAKDASINHAREASNNSSTRDASRIIKSSEAFPRSRFHHAACSLGKYVYIFGGKDRYSPLRDMWRLDTVTQEWEQVEDTKSRIPHLQGHTMLAYKSQLLIFGGTFSDTSEDTPLWIYNTDLNHIHKFCCESYIVRPVGRREHSAVIYKANMYIYGGFLDSSGSTDEFWAFSIEEEEWRMIRRHKPGKRHGHVAVVSDNKLWLHGGMRGLIALSDLWTFNFGTNTWSKAKGIGVSPALSSHTAHVVDNSIILFGGSRSGTPSQDVWIFRIDTLTWRHISTQSGDPCPPITLHTSVLLSSAVIQNVSRDRTQSVPQLKGKPMLCSELKSLRPWTSPTVNSTACELNIHSSTASNAVDILCLDALGADLDGNNNNSEEDIHRRLDSTWTEIETSFCSEDNVQTSRGSSNQQSLAHSSATGCTHLKCSGQLGPATGQWSETGKLRSASVEHCGDVVPLLSRFHSVNSDADLGESNLTITLSDEEIFTPGILEQNEQNIQLKKYNLSTGLNKYGKISTESMGASITGNYLNNLFTEKGFVTKEELFESLSIFRKERDKEFMNLDFCKDARKIKSFQNTELVSMEKDISKGNDRKTAANSLSNIQISGQADASFLSTFSRNVFEPCEKTAAYVTSLSEKCQNLRGSEGYMQPEKKCLSDLIIEDLESCDISEALNNVKISSPRRPYLRSCSLKDLYSCVSYYNDYVESHFGTFELSKSQLTRSCGNLAYWQNNEVYEKKVKKFLIEKNTKNYISEMQPMKNLLSKNEANSGKYIKHATSATWRNPSNLSRSRGNIYKVTNSGKISIGTQTTGSQTLLPDPKSHLSVDSSTKLGHFVTGVAASESTHQYEAAQSTQRHPKPATTVDSIFLDSKVCILVIGGQTESHSFHTEPLKMWRCCLY